MEKHSTKRIELRWNLLKQVKSRVELIEGAEDPELRAYFLSYKKELYEQKWWPVQRSQLIGDILQSDIVIGGDFHAFAQSQRTHLRLLRSLKRLNRPLVLALECFESKHQALLDHFLEGDVSQEQFLKEIDWEQSWGFPWKNYWPLVKLAKRKGYRILAVNSKSQLDSKGGTQKRDQHIAQALVNAKKQNKDALVYLVIGDLHLSEDNLPAQIRSLQPEYNTVSVFQNSEKLYFDLLEEGLENKVDILKSKKNQYCILTSPPWVKWQSYLMYLESCDDYDIQDVEFLDDFEGDDDWDDDDFSMEYDFTDQLSSIFNFLTEDLDLNVSLDNVELFTHLTDFLLDRFKNELSLGLYELVQEHLQNSKSFYLPEMGVLYLSRLTTNHASEIIGKYIQAELSQRKTTLFDMPSDFKKLIWIETLAYFFSKNYNHKRKTMSFKNLKSELLSLNPSDSEHEILKLSLGQTMNEFFAANNIQRKKSHIGKTLKPYSYIESARILGQFKGEQLFQAYRSGRIGKDTLHTYINKNVHDSDFESFYQLIVKRLLSSRSAKDKKEYIL